MRNEKLNETFLPRTFFFMISLKHRVRRVKSHLFSMDCAFFWWLCFVCCLLTLLQVERRTRNNSSTYKVIVECTFFHFSIFFAFFFSSPLSSSTPPSLSARRLRHCLLLTFIWLKSEQDEHPSQHTVVVTIQIK